MNALIALSLLLVPTLSFAKDKPSCDISARHGFFNGGHSEMKPISLLECMGRAQKLFDGVYRETHRYIHLNNTATLKTWEFQYAKIRVIHRTPDGKVSRHVYVREDARMELVDEKPVVINTWDCWTRGECE